MTTHSDDGDTRQNCSVHIQMTRAQLGQLESLRAALQAGVTGARSISRSDVLRLAMGRLYLAWLTHLSELPGPPADLIEQWNTTATVMQAEGTCPAWLFPGQAEPRPASKKKGR